MLIKLLKTIIIVIWGFFVLFLFLSPLGYGNNPNFVNGDKSTNCGITPTNPTCKDAIKKGKVFIYGLFGIVGLICIDTLLERKRFKNNDSNYDNK